jgi:hypothetical protein
VSRILATALLATGFVGISGPDSCVSRERCEAACAERGGYAWVVAVQAAETDCICADWAFVEIGGGDA